MNICYLHTILGVLLILGCETPTDVSETFAGMYSGNGMYQFVDAEQLTMSSLRIEAVQSGGQMTISGTETIQGQVIAIGAITGQVSETGFFSAARRGTIGTYRHVSCGRYTSTDFTMAFASGNLRITEHLTTAKCGEMTFSAVLVKER